MEFKMFVSGNAPRLFPADTFFGLLWYDSTHALEIPKCYPFSGTWGKPLSTHLTDREEYPVPGRLDMVWLSVVERKFYSLEKDLPVDRMEQLFRMRDEESGASLFEYIIVGMAPYGGVAVWLNGRRKAELVAWMKAEETQVDMADFMPSDPDMTVEENCRFYIGNDPAVKENLERNGLPPADLYDKYMQQYTYRYVVSFGRQDGEEWVEYDGTDKVPESVFMEDSRFDGSYDKLRDGALLRFHDAGRPEKISIGWSDGKSPVNAYFWFDDARICQVFDRFYGIHPDTRTDFMFRIDPQRKSFQLFLYRFGLKEPFRVPEDAYQYIVFRNRFEAARSGNYAQPRGAWIW